MLYKNQWRKLSGQFLNGSIEKEVEQAIVQERNKGYQLQICIGTDSQLKGNYIDFATAIVFVRNRDGGFMFVKKEKLFTRMSIKERMLQEVGKSIEVAYMLHAVFDKLKIAAEIHADINTDPTFKSNEALKDAMGYILGMGYVFKAKPLAFASTSCANKVLH